MVVTKNTTNYRQSGLSSTHDEVVIIKHYFLVTAEQTGLLKHLTAVTREDIYVKVKKCEN